MLRVIDLALTGMLIGIFQQYFNSVLTPNNNYLSILVTPDIDIYIVTVVTNHINT